MGIRVGGDGGTESGRGRLRIVWAAMESDGDWGSARKRGGRGASGERVEIGGGWGQEREDKIDYYISAKNKKKLIFFLFHFHIYGGAHHFSLQQYNDMFSRTIRGR